MTNPAPMQLTQRSPFWFPELPDKLSRAVKEYKLVERPDWQPLEELSNQTLFEGIEVYGDAAVIEGDALIAPATIYVRLTYDPNSDDVVSFEDSYPARVFFSSDSKEKRVTVNKIHVDTTSFFQ